MRRTMLTLIVFAALSAWAGAQGTAPLSAEIQIKQFQSNRILIENLVSHGIELSKADNPLQRAAACRQTARTLANSLENAARDKDADRVAEFAHLYGEVVRDGLVPNLEAASNSIPAGSPQWADLQTIRDKAKADFEGVHSSIPTTGKVGDNDKVKAALALIEGLKGKLEK